MAEGSISSEGSQLIKSREDNSDNNDDSDIEQLPISETNDDKSQVQFDDKIGLSGFRKDSNINGNNFTHDSKDIQKSPLSESSSDGLLSDCLSTGPRSRLTSTEDTDSTIKPGKPVDSDSSDGKSIETLDYASSEDKSFEAIDSEEDKQALDYPNRPESLFLQRPMHYEKRRSRSDEHKKIDTARTMSSSTAVDIPVRNDPEFMNLEETMLSKSMPYGTVIRKGEMIEFVADDLQEMIKRSSPLTQTASSTTSSRRSSLRSYSSVSSSTSSAVGVSRSPSSLFQQSPDDIPPIDPQAINDLEMHALHVADNLDLLMGNLRNNLHKMSAITVGCLSAYKTSVDTTCDSVDSSIKSMYALMAKCEELSNSMKPVNKLAEQIKEIKRLLDRFEAQIADKQ